MERANILLVDDRPENLLALQATLSELPVRCVEASCGPDAIRWAQESDFAVVLLDVQMPVMNGFETAAELRRHERSRTTPIIFLTAMHKEERNVLDGYSHGAVDYLFKPLDPDILIGKVRVFVEVYHQRQLIERQAIELRETVRGLREAHEDIRSKEELLRQLRAAKEGAESANRAKSQFLANMSHELRTPLHGIISFARFGLKKAKDADRAKLTEYFEQIASSAGTLLTLLNDVLDLAKLEAGKMKLATRRTDLRVLVGAVMEEVKICAQDRSVTISCEDSTTEYQAACDGNRIKQVVRNLLTNSIRFSPEGGQILIQFRNEGSSVEVTVRDEGVGIPDEELSAVFDKFVQSSKTTTGAGGTGLGLAICRQIVEAHDGAIWAKNEKTGGATFVFRIPVDGPEQERVAEASCSLAADAVVVTNGGQP